jgi:formiminotetrahydrofolate cyclodeaminase
MREFENEKEKIKKCLRAILDIDDQAFEYLIKLYKHYKESKDVSRQ